MFKPRRLIRLTLIADKPEVAVDERTAASHQQTDSPNISNPCLNIDALNEYVNLHPAPVFSGPQPFSVYEQEVLYQARATECATNQKAANSSSRSNFDSSLSNLKMSLLTATAQDSRSKVKEQSIHASSSSLQPLAGQRQLSGLIKRRFRPQKHPYSHFQRNDDDLSPKLTMAIPQPRASHAVSGAAEPLFAIPTPIFAATYSVLPPGVTALPDAGSLAPTQGHFYEVAGSQYRDCRFQFVSVYKSEPILPLQAPIRLRPPSTSGSTVSFISENSAASDTYPVSQEILPSDSTKREECDFWDIGAPQSPAEYGNETSELEETGNIFDIFAAGGIK